MSSWRGAWKSAMRPRPGGFWVRPRQGGTESCRNKFYHLRMLRDLPLRQLAAVLAEFQLYVGNDSGVTHLAAALGGPAVAAIFGPSDPVIWAPQGDRTIVVTSEQPCAPCTLGREIPCPEAVCLSALTPEKVLAAISRIFSENI